MSITAKSLERKTIPFIMHKQLLQNQETAKYDQIYDDEFVSLINGLNESIKEYYKVSRNNITEANSFILFYEQQGIAIQNLMNEIMSTNSYSRINEFFEQIPKINEIMAQLQLNANSNEKNLNLFFEDAKILFKKMKMKRKEKIIELNNNINIYNYNNLNDSFSNSYNFNQPNYIKNNNLGNNNNNYNLKNTQSFFKRNNLNNINSAQNTSILMSINNIYSQIIKLLNNFSEFNFMINKINFDSSNKFINLQNSIKLELDKLINLVKMNLNKNNNKIFNKILPYNNFNDEQNKRSHSIPGGLAKDYEKLKKINQINEKKIFDLNNQLNTFRKNMNNYNIGFNSDYESKIRELEINNNNLNIKLMQAEQLIKEKDNLILNYQSNSNTLNNNNLINNNLNLSNILKQKEAQILNLQQQLYVYQKNEDLLNNQISDLNNKFQTKINQYESQISLINDKTSSLPQIILNKNKDILKLQNENAQNKKEIERLKQIINSKGMPNMQNAPIEEYEQIIEGLKNDINNYQNMINQYENQIMELSQNNSNGINMNNNMTNNTNYELQNQIEILNKEMQLKESEFIKEREMILNKNALNEQKINQINQINSKNNKIIQELKMKINQLNKDILNYQRKGKAFEENNNKYIKQIEEMNNNILYTNKIIEQKDDLIKQLNERTDINNNNIQLQKERDDYKFQFEQMQKKYINLKELLENNNINNENNNNNDNILKMKLMDIQFENEKLQKQIQDLTNINNNNLLLKDKITNGNDFQQNNDLMKKVKELTLENKKYQDSLASTNELISKLELDITKKNEELEGLKAFIFKLQSQLEKEEDSKVKKDESKKNSSMNVRNNNEYNKGLEAPKDANTAMINNILNKLNDAEKKITFLQKKNKELQFQLEEKQAEKEISGYRTEDVNFSNYEEEFDLKKMVNGARDKNRSEDINIDYPGVQGIKDKYKELLQNLNILEEQVKILISNINCNNKIKPQITQICQLMKISPKNIQLIIAGKDKKRALGLIG